MSAQTPTICIRCLDVSPSGQRFCGSCGAELTTSSEANDAIRIATVAFADVAEFTSLSARLSLEQIKLLMDTVFERLYRVVLDHGGVVDKYIGDCVMALFGVPEVDGDDAARGVHAALAMQRALDDLGPELEARELPAVRMRIGVDSGAVIAGAVGAGPQRRYTVMGPPVNRAAHLQQEAPVGTVFVGDGCQRRVRGLFRLEPRSAAGGPAYLVRGERFGGRWLAPRELLGAGGEIVGRGEQLSRLQEVFNHVVAEGQARALLLLGGAGIGKSRLAFEFLAAFDEERGVRRLFGRGQSLGRGVPFAMVADALERLLHLEGVDTEERERRFRRMLGALGFDESPRDLETLRQILDPPLEPSGARTSAQVFAQRAMDMVARLLDRLAARRPTVLVIDDLHLCDGPTVQLLGYLLRRLAHRPLLVLGLARPQLLLEQPQLVHAERVERIDLDNLDQQTVASLVERTLRGPAAETPAAPADIRELTALVVQRSEGNPQQVEELLRSFEDSGVLQRRVDGWRVGATPELPPDEEGVADLRVAPLAGGLSEVLAQAAVFGRLFWRDGLCALGAEEDDLERLLGELQRRELIVPRSSSQLRGEREYAFSSDALVSAAYRHNPKDRLPELHRRAAIWLGERPLLSAEVWAEAGRHRALAGEPAAARELLGRAGDVAYRATAYADAATYYGRAIALAEASAGHPGAEEALFSLLGRRERVLNALGRWAEQREDAERMLELAAAEGERSWEIEALLRVGRTALNSGDHESALETFERAHRLGDPAKDPEPCARALRWRALVHFNRSEHRQALPLFEEALHLAEAGGRGELAAELAYEMGVTVGTVGDYARAVEVSLRALEMFREQHNAYQEAFCLGNLGCFYCYLGDYQAALGVLEKAVELGVELGAPLAEGSARANLGYARCALGDIDEALRLEVAAREVGEAIGDPRLVADACVYEALALLSREGPREEELDRARLCAAQALALAEDAGMPGSEAMAQAALARAHWLAGDLAAAETASQRALTVLEGVGSIEGFESMIQLVHARICLARGDHEGLRRTLSWARRELLSKAAWIPAGVRRERFLGAVRDNAALLALADEHLGPGEPGEGA